MTNLLFSYFMYLLREKDRRGENKMSLLYKQGDEGQEVMRAQRVLSGLVDDGKFGPKTYSAVQDFQKKSGLTVDGVVGPASRSALGIDMYAGIDVSHWNGNVRWGNVNKNKVNFVWTKISQGVDYTDPSAKRNLHGCRNNGISVGGYHFPSPQVGGSNDPKLEVQDFLKYYGGCIPSGDMLPVLDLEAGVKGDPDHNRQWALEWLKELENETGLRAVVYTAKWYVYSYLKNDVGSLVDYPLWVADYTQPYKEGGRNEPDSTCGWDEWSVWQWTSKGQIVGLDATGIRKCDRNWLCGGPTKFESLKVR
jgi:lysozyme